MGDGDQSASNRKVHCRSDVREMSLVNIHDPFDVVFVEEAWQMGWADFMLLGQVAERFVLIGDPGRSRLSSRLTSHVGRHLRDRLISRHHE